MKLTLHSTPVAAVRSSPRKITPVMPTLRLNDTGDYVITLQNWLNRYLSPVAVDGVFRLETQLAVRIFQYRMFLPSIGTVEQATWDALVLGMPIGLPILHLGSQGEQVVWAQEVLFGLGLYLYGSSHMPSQGRQHIDGQFGPQTETAVRRYQASRGLPNVDGIVGERTWAALAGDRLQSTGWLSP